METIIRNYFNAWIDKSVLEEMWKIQWGTLAYIEKNGGGPEGNHTHSDIFSTHL